MFVSLFSYQMSFWVALAGGFWIPGELHSGISYGRGPASVEAVGRLPLEGKLKWATHFDKNKAYPVNKVVKEYVDNGAYDL